MGTAINGSSSPRSRLKQLFDLDRELLSSSALVLSRLQTQIGVVMMQYSYEHQRLTHHRRHHTPIGHLPRLGKTTSPGTTELI